MSEATAGSKLPRGRNADRPRPDEKVRKQTGADLQNGWWGRHGTLTLTDDRLVFVPTLLDALMRARRHEVVLDAVPTTPVTSPLAASARGCCCTLRNASTHSWSGISIHGSTASKRSTNYAKRVGVRIGRTSIAPSRKT
jgi:hypothetical protein